MGRPFIFFADTKSPSPRSDAGATPSYSTSRSGPKRAHTRAALVADAESAALQIIELCDLLNQHYGLAGASYTEFSSCRAALLVILAQSLNGQTETLRTALATGMKLIKVMAVSIDSVKSEVSVIEALETAIKRLDTSSNMLNEGNEKQKESGYEKFRSWAALWKGEQEESSLIGFQPSSQPTSFPESFSWAHSDQGTGGNELADVAIPTVEDQLIDLGMGTMHGNFLIPDFDEFLGDQWEVGFGANGLDNGMNFDG